MGDDNLHQILEDWETYTQTTEYQDHLRKHQPKHKREQAACTPPAFQQAACTPPASEEGSGGTASSTAGASTHPQPAEPLRGRGSEHANKLQELRKLRKAASKGKADAKTME